jgi:hypothetical protein
VVAENPLPIPIMPKVLPQKKKVRDLDSSMAFATDYIDVLNSFFPGHPAIPTTSPIGWKGSM